MAKKNLDSRLKQLEKAELPKGGIAVPTDDPDLYRWVGHEDRLYRMDEINAGTDPTGIILIWNPHHPEPPETNDIAQAQED